MARIRYQSGSTTITFLTSCQQSVSSAYGTCYIRSTRLKGAWLALTKLGAAKSVCVLATAHLVASWATVMGYQK